MMDGIMTASAVSDLLAIELALLSDHVV